MKKKHYPPRLPPRRGIAAQMNFYEEALIMDELFVRLSLREKNYLRMLVNADMKNRTDDYRHAVAFGVSDYVDPTIDECCVPLLAKLDELPTGE